MAILYPATQLCRVHSYTVLYTFKIYRSAVILEVDRSFGGRSGAIAVSLALLLLAVVADIVAWRPIGRSHAATADTQ